MTIRSGNQALQNQKLRRAHTLCTLFRIVRRDGFVLRFTDHDRPLTVDGAAYFPIGLGSVSAERRESGLRSGNQEASGPIDGDTITIPDLLGHRYRGATVYQSIVDWRRPWVQHYASRKTVRTVALDGSSWVATLEGMGARLQRSAGGRFGGTYSTQCPYTLFDPTTCKADPMIGFVFGPSSQFTVTSATTLTLTDSGASWTTDEWVGYQVVVTSGVTGARGRPAEVLSNTTTTATLTTQLPAVPAAGNDFHFYLGLEIASVVDPRMAFVLDDTEFTASSYADDSFRDGEAQWITGANAGIVSPIVGYVQSSRTATLLFPTPFDIEAGDRAVIRVGCDGLKGTCKDKFFPIGGSATGNVVNFGGTDVYSPGAGATLEQPA